MFPLRSGGSFVAALAIAIASTAAVAALEVPAAAQPWDGEQHWGIGFHASALGLAPAGEDASDEDTYDLGGGGIQLRYRINRRWEIEAELDQVSGQLEGGGPSRQLSSLAVTGMFHINPYHQWVWSALAGFAAGRDDVRFLERIDSKPMRSEVSFSHGQFHIGAGIERRFRKVGVGAQLRLIGMGRNDDELDGPAFEGMDLPTPHDESGGRLDLYANYYF